MNVSLRQLRAFVAVAHTGSFTRAAEQLHITQAGLSAMVRELETQLGCRLFDRTTRSVALTRAGVTFRESAERALAEIDRAAQAIGRLQEEGRTRLVIGTTPVLSSSLLPQVCERLAAVEPDVQVVVRDLDRRAIQSGVEAGELDAGYGVFLDVASGIRRVPLLDIPMIAVRASGAADIRRSSVAMEWRDFTDLPLVCLPADNPVQRLVDAQLSASEVLPVERHEFENMHTVLAMSEAGMGYSILPAFIQPSAQRYRVASHPLTRPRVTCEFYEITKKGRQVNWTVARFTACLKEALLQTC
jgi:DNA-binding transcriptional LysR family regulator